MLFTLGLLLTVSVIYLSEQKRTAARQKEDAWEGKWLDIKSAPTLPWSIFCVCVWLFVWSPWFSRSLNLLYFLSCSVLCFSTGHSFLPMCFPRNGFPLTFLLDFHPLVLLVSAPTVRLPAVLHQMRACDYWFLTFMFIFCPCSDCCFWGW